MTRIGFLLRIAERYLRGKRTGLDDLARDYDLAAPSYAETWLDFMGPVNRAFLAHLAPPRQGRVLDLGCGTGLVYEQLRRQGFGGEYRGMDASAGMLARFPKAPQATVLKGDVHPWVKSLPSQSFDCVTAIWSWEYLDRARLLPQIRRLLRPDGQALLLANRRDTLPELEAAFLALMARRPREIRKVFHLALRTPRDAEEMAREAGRAGLTVLHRCEGEQVHPHASAQEAVAWGFRTGALAGTRCVLGFQGLDAALAGQLARANPAQGPFTTTHRYAGVVAALPPG